MKKAFVLFLAVLFALFPMLSFEAVADQKLSPVEFTVPADFVEGETTQEALDAQVNENGWKSATLNEDGSVTYEMSKVQHKEMMEVLKVRFDEGLPDIINSEDYPNFVSVTANDDYTEFKITTRAESLNFAETFSVLAFYMVGGMYNSFNGTPANNISVQYINEASGAIIEEYNSGNMDATDTGASDVPGTDSTDADTSTTVYNMAETIIVDDDNCTVIATEIIPDGMWGFTVKVLLENKTDNNVMFSMDNVSVVGYMIDPFWAQEVAPGKKAVSEISFSNSDLKKCGIASVDEIMFELLVYDTEDWAAEKLVDDTFAIYPTGLTAETVVYPDRQGVEGERVILDNELCVFIVQSVDPDDLWGYTLKCYIENKTDNNVMFTWDGVSVNGFMCDPYWAKTVAGEKRVYTDISFSTSDFETCSIETVTDIEFTLKASDADTYNTLFAETFAYMP